MSHKHSEFVLIFCPIEALKSITTNIKIVFLGGGIRNNVEQHVQSEQICPQNVSQGGRTEDNMETYLVPWRQETPQRSPQS